MEINKIFESKKFKWFILITLCIIVLLFVLQVGIFIGSRRADFAFKWGENYHRNFAGPKGGFLQEFAGPDREFMDASGVFGSIIRIDGKTLIINDKDGVEKMVLVTDKTVIREQRRDIKLSDIKIDDNIVAIGDPNDLGQIEAKLIRIMPPLPMTPMNNFMPRPPM